MIKKRKEEFCPKDVEKLSEKILDITDEFHPRLAMAALTSVLDFIVAEYVGNPYDTYLRIAKHFLERSKKVKPRTENAE